MCCNADINSASACLLCCLSKCPLNLGFLDIHLTTFSESVISKLENLWGSCLFSKSSKFKLHFKNPAKNWEIKICFWDNCIWIGIVNPSLLRTGYFSSTTNVLTSSPKIWHVNKRDFFQLSWLGSDQSNLSRCCDADFNSAWARFPCCLFKGPPKRGLLDIYMTTFSESVISKLQNLWGSSFFPKCSKSNLDFINAAKNWEKVFSFWYNCIWIGIVKLSLLRRGYFSLRANVLTSSPKIEHVNKRYFFKLTRLGKYQWIWSRCSDPDFNSPWARLPCCLWKGPLNWGFLHIYLTTFS